MNLIIIQVRNGSTRLPRKALMKFNNSSIIQKIIDESKEISDVYKIYLATTVLKQDDIFEQIAYENKISIFRGSKSNVFSRFRSIVESENNSKFQSIIRLTGDNPFIESKIANKVIFEHYKNKNFYTSNNLIRTWPIGLDIEIVDKTYFLSDFNNSFTPEDNEHVTLFIKRNLSKFKHQNVKAPSYETSKKIRLTIDFPEDIQFSKEILNYLKSENLNVNVRNIIRLYNKYSELRNINDNVLQTNIKGIS